MSNDELTEDATDERRIVRALKISLAIIGVAIVAIILARVWMNREKPDENVVQDLEATGPQISLDDEISPPVVQFTDIAEESGIDFVHVNGAYGERLLPETMGGGVAFLDVDDDGHQDLLFVNSSAWPGHTEPAQAATSRLYRNLGDGNFEDISQKSGLDLELYGMGAAVGDYDGDGWVDIFITAVGENRLLKNLDGQTFVDVTDATGVAGDDDAWSTSAAFFDYDRDGDLDLVVANYVRWSAEINREVDYRLNGIGRAYGPPTDFLGTDSYLYRNDDGVFVDVSESAGIRVVQDSTSLPVGKGLAVHPVDVNDDGWLDLVVANDTVRNFLFLNEHDGRFREAGVDFGFAYNASGLATGAMGVDAAYATNDGDLSIAIGNFANEMSSYYVRRAGEEVFSDDAIVAGIGADSRRALTFGLMFLDIDSDGRQDLLASNGHVEPEINSIQSSQRYEQPLQLFWNCGSACKRNFKLLENATGDLDIPRAGRGAAYADIDGDGDLDIALTAVDGRPALLRNDQKLGNHWLRIKLRAASPNVHAIGATVRVVTSDATQTRTVMPSRSYLSQVELPLTFGLGETDSVDEVSVTWPDGTTESWAGIAIDSVHTLTKGSSAEGN